MIAVICLIQKMLHSKDEFLTISKPYANMSCDQPHRARTTKRISRNSRVSTPYIKVHQLSRVDFVNNFHSYLQTWRSCPD